jgi:hypothetical protein
MRTGTGRFLPLPATSASPARICLTSSASRSVPGDADISCIHTINLCDNVSKVCPCASCLILMQSEGKSQEDAAPQRPPTQRGDTAAPDVGAAGSDTTQDVIQSAVGCQCLQPIAPWRTCQ